MEKNLTPMMELIEWMREQNANAQNPKHGGIHLYVPKEIISKATSLLEKEKEVIKTSYKAGQDNIIKQVEAHNKKNLFFEISFDEPDSPEDYFNQTFNK